MFVRTVLLSILLLSLFLSVGKLGFYGRGMLLPSLAWLGSVEIPLGTPPPPNGAGFWLPFTPARLAPYWLTSLQKSLISIELLHKF
jgi:hypothetical protein